MNPKSTELEVRGSPPKIEPSAVRRGKGAQLWLIADGDHRYFSGGFTSGIMEDVKFLHTAPIMLCEENRRSTGEAVGLLRQLRKDPEIPRGAKNLVGVVYDPTRRMFHIKGLPEKKIDSADYLLLFSDGSTTAGWKE